MADEMKEFLKEISKSNAGAVDVFYRLIAYSGDMVILDFLMLKQMDVLGSDLWDLWKECDRDIEKLHNSIMSLTAPEKLQGVRGSKFYKAPEPQ